LERKVFELKRFYSSKNDSYRKFNNSEQNFGNHSNSSNFMADSNSANYLFDPMAYCSYHRYPMRGHSFENCHRHQRSTQWYQLIGMNKFKSYQKWLKAQNSFNNAQKVDVQPAPVPETATVVDSYSFINASCCPNSQFDNTMEHSSKNIVLSNTSKAICSNNTISLDSTQAKKPNLTQKETSQPIISEQVPIKLRKCIQTAENTQPENTFPIKIKAQMADEKVYLYPTCCTGSQFTVVSKNFVSKFAEKLVSCSENTSPKQVSNFENVLGTAKFYLNIGDEKFAICAEVVPNIREDIILGANFFGKNRGRINMAKKFVELRGNKFPFQNDKCSTNVVNKVSVSCIQMQNLTENFTTKQTSDELTKANLVQKVLIENQIVPNCVQKFPPKQWQHRKISNQSDFVQKFQHKILSQ